jgi:hypothetical protein
LESYVWDVGDPDLIGASHRHRSDEVRIASILVRAVGGARCPTWGFAHQVEFVPEPRHVNGINRPAWAAQHLGQPSVALGRPLARDEAFLAQSNASVKRPTSRSSLAKSLFLINFELVILPEGDQELHLSNRKLLNKFVSEGKPIVFAQLRTSQENAEPIPNFYVPLAR